MSHQNTYNLSEPHERIYLVFPSSEYLFLELRLLRGMACLRKQKRSFSKPFLAQQLVSPDKFEFVLQSFHDGDPYYSPPYIHEKADPEVFSTLRPLFDLPPRPISEEEEEEEVYKGKLLDYWDEICLPFPVEAEYQKQEYIFIDSLSDQVFKGKSDKKIELTLVVPQLDSCWGFTLHMSQLYQQLSADKVELIVSFLQDKTRGYISASEDPEVFSSTRSLLPLPSDKIKLVFESKCFWRNNAPQLVLTLLRGYDTPESFYPCDITVPLDMYREDNRGHDSLVPVLLSEFQERIPAEKVDHLLALLRDPSHPFISRCDHPEEFALLYPFFISPIPNYLGVFQLPSPVIIYSRSEPPMSKVAYLDIEYYYIPGVGECDGDSVEFQSLEEVKQFVPSNILDRVLQSLQDEITVIVTEDDDAEVFDSLREAITSKSEHDAKSL